MKKTASNSYDNWLNETLKNDAELAKEYIKTAFAEATDAEGRKTLLNAIKQVAKAQGISKVADAAGIRRESLSRALSEKGNPRIDTLLSIIRAMGLQLTIKPISADI